MPDPPDPDWMSIVDVAARLGVSVDTVDRWIMRGFLPVERHRGASRSEARRVWIRAADVEAFAAWYYRNGLPPPWMDRA